MIILVYQRFEGQSNVLDYDLLEIFIMVVCSFIYVAACANRIPRKSLSSSMHLQHIYQPVLGTPHQPHETSILSCIPFPVHASVYAL